MVMPLARSTIWLLSSLLLWLVFGLAGGLAPIWQFLLAAAVLGMLDVVLGRHRGWTTPLLAAVMPLGIAAVAWEPPPALWVTGLAVMSAAIAAAIGRLAHSPVMRARRLGLVPITLALVLIGSLAVNTLLPRSHGPWVPLPRLLTFHAMVMPAAVPDAERVVLESGAVAWHTPAEAGAAPSTAFFHGAHSQGSGQPAAVVARRALHEAGYAVLAVDHPGYGESPVPDLADLARWDPSPTASAAAGWLAGRNGGAPVYAMGHSKGASDVLRLLGNGQELAAAVLLGAGVIDPLDPNDADQYWVRRVRVDRGLPDDALDTATVAGIWNTYYDNATLAARLTDDSPPIHLVDFGIEFADVVAARERTLSLLPARTVRHELAGVGHYFDSRRWGGLVIADARAFAAAVDFFTSIRGG